MQIYLAEGTQHTGPFDLDTVREGLRTGRFQPGPLAWYEGAPGWEPVSRLPGLVGPVYHPLGKAPRRAWWPVVGGIVAGLFILAGAVFLLGRDSRPDHPDRPEHPDRRTPRVVGVTPPPAARPSAPGPSAVPRPSGSPIPVAPAVPAVPVAPAVPADAIVPVAPAVPATGTQHYAADRARYSGNLAAHFVPFSFDYPADWTVDETISEEYVEVYHYGRLPDGSNALVESVSFSYAFCRPGYSLAANLPAVGAQLLGSASTSLASAFPRVAKTAAPHPGHFGRYPSQEQFLVSPPADGSPGAFFRQAIVARPDSSGADGMFINLFSTDAAGTTNVEGLGKSGGLRTLEESFRFER